jgi:sugar transferase (PEP-CTERM/EpsH1 system associated)
LDNVAGLEPLVSGVDAVKISRTRGRFRALSALASGTRPLTVAFFDEPELRLVVRERVINGEVDLALVCSSGMATFVDNLDLPRIIQFTDLDSQKWRLYAEASRWPKSWVYRTEARRLLEYERHIARTFEYSLFCSTRELEDFRRLIPGVPAECIRNGVDSVYFQPTNEPKVADNLVFTGVMNYRPNVDGVVWFCREVLPIIRSHVPTTTLTICGASPSPEVRQLGQLTGVNVTGAVDDVRPHMARASMGVIPVRIARGIQNKLLEAMAMGLPTVTTSAAQAGLEAQDGRDLLVADQPAAFAAAVVRLLQNEKLRVQIGKAARIAVETHYRWERSLAQLDEVIASVMSGRSSHKAPHLAVTTL